MGTSQPPHAAPPGVQESMGADAQYDKGTERPRLIGSEIYRFSRYGGTHPLAIPRVSTVIDLCRALGWLQDERYIDSPQATPDQLARFHHPDYIEALLRAERDQSVDERSRRRYNIGAGGNPIFGQVFSRPATACGATLLAVDMLMTTGGVVYNPAGGTHHGRPDRASGFCYFNDPVLGLLAFLDRGLDRVAYVDVDAHHCDGVEDAFFRDPRVLTISVHELDRWPFTGTRSRLLGDGGALNLPVPAGFNDTEMAYLWREAVIPRLDAFEPQAIVLQCGADALLEDPLSRLALSNQAIWKVTEDIAGRAPRILVLGGGGYNPWSVGRCWSGLWAVLNGLEIPVKLPQAAESILRGLRWHRAAGRNPPPHWFTTLADPGRPGSIGTYIRDLASSARR